MVPARTTPATRLSAVGEWSSAGSGLKPTVPVDVAAVGPMAQAPSRTQYGSLPGSEKVSTRFAGVRRSSRGSTRRERRGVGCGSWEFVRWPGRPGAAAPYRTVGPRRPKPDSAGYNFFDPPARLVVSPADQEPRMGGPDLGTSVTLLGRLRARGSDPAAWAEFVARYEPLITAWGRRWGLQAADASDVTQTVLLRLAERIGEVRVRPGEELPRVRQDVGPICLARLDGFEAATRGQRERGHGRGRGPGQRDRPRRPVRAAGRRVRPRAVRAGGRGRPGPRRAAYLGGLPDDRDRWPVRG